MIPTFIIFHADGTVVEMNNTNWVGASNTPPNSIIYEHGDEVPWVQTKFNPKLGYYALREDDVPAWCKAYVLLLT